MHSHKMFSFISVLIVGSLALITKFSYSCVCVCLFSQESLLSFCLQSSPGRSPIPLPALSCKNISYCNRDLKPLVDTNRCLDG